VAVVGFSSPSDTAHKSVLSPDITTQEYLNCGAQVDGPTSNTGLISFVMINSSPVK
jgi:hypothetical protein